jgi:hypothetical protein
VPVSQVAAHPCSIARPIHVSDPGSPRAGTVQNRQARSPVDAR